MTLNSGGTECKIDDPCLRCARHAPHPPILVVYDEEHGDYELPAERVCMARWASTNSDHATRSICGAPATHHAGDVGLCQHHWNRVYEWRFWDKPREDIEEKTRALREADREYRQAVRDSAIYREQVDAECSVVYFIRRTSDGMVKIGTTGSFPQRMNAIRAEHGEIQVLFTRSGSRKLEQQMHAKFAEYRIARTEWFMPVRPLLWWIYEERSRILYRKSQKPGVVRPVDVRRLAEAAPRVRDLAWKGGRVVWPPPEAA